MAGKKVGKFITIDLDDSGATARDISNDVVAINGLPINYNKVEVGGFSQDMFYLLGRRDQEVTLTVLVNDTATTGAHTVIKDIVGGNTARTLNIEIGDNAAPTSNDVKYSGEVLCQNYVVNPDLNGPVTADATFVPADNTGLVWGTV